MDFQLDISILEQVYRHLDKSVAKINGLKKYDDNEKKLIMTDQNGNETANSFWEVNLYGA